MAAAFVFFLALLWTVYLLVTTWPLARRVRRLSKEYRKEKARRYWAEARELLFNLVRDEKLAHTTATFRLFNSFQTYMLRRPDAYDEISRELVARLTSGPGGSIPSELGQEMLAWPEEMRTVIDRMAVGLAILVFGFEGRRHLLPFGIKVVKQLGKRGIERVWALLRHLPGGREKSDLLEAMWSLYTLRTATA